MLICINDVKYTCVCLSLLKDNTQLKFLADQIKENQVESFFSIKDTTTYRLLLPSYTINKTFLTVVIIKQC